MKEDRIDQRDFYEWMERDRERERRYPRAGEVLICSRKLLNSYVRSTVPEPCLPFLFRSTPPLVRPKANECPTPKVLHWHRLWAWSSSSVCPLWTHACCFEHFRQLDSRQRKLLIELFSHDHRQTEAKVWSEDCKSLINFLLIITAYKTFFSFLNLENWFIIEII